MDSAEFTEFGTAMIQYITQYLDNIRDRRVLPTVQPGYIQDLIPAEAPEEGEKWQDVMKDIERVIMPGVTHWHSPNFHAFYPTANSYPAIVADMLSGAIACIGFTWMSSPACTELEVVTLDWLGKAIDLPPQFLSGPSNGKGGGVIQGTASEATLVALLSARTRFAKKHLSNARSFDEDNFISKLVSYTSEQSHSSVERAGMLGGVKMRMIPTDEDLRMRGADLKAAIQKDKAAGLIPFFVVATLGSTNSCAFDALDEIGDVCQEEEVWLHVDAAYAGAAFVCEEYRYLMVGMDKADSFNFNPHKWMLVNFDCSAMWIKDANEVVEAFNVDPFYLKHDMQGKAPDYRHWQIPLGRRFRSLKLWFVMRIYGLKKIKEHIRIQIRLAHDFEQMLRKDNRFEIVTPVIMGLVCFRLKDKSNEDNEKLLKRINERGKIHIVPAKIKDLYIIRFAICSRFTNLEDVKIGWQEIQDATTELFPSK
ncbi:Aromatic-L-amino-acid decarboxylase [Orchesella cincta]|uniref:Aromatic-L-amino-acid decarboxylase n=1 Tax=Orchesella cincta TaxID=48709 RepID=A0A1D2NMP1_ORCCI|nr:Aromatic-L-amino-acid decarboxylase [Orchesella cincta]